MQNHTPTREVEEENDPLDLSHFHLETAFFTSGHDLGLSEGSRAGKIEGRLFGLEKGFEKFAEMGRLGGRAAIWGARFDLAARIRTAESAAADDGGACGGARALKLAPLLPGRDGGGSSSGNVERLRKRIERLKALTDPVTLDRENSEEAVDAVDERLRDARARAGVIERVLGEESLRRDDQGGGDALVGERGEVLRRDRLRVKGEAKATAAAKGSSEMEDFAGLPGQKKDTTR